MHDQLVEQRRHRGSDLQLSNKRKMGERLRFVAPFGDWDLGGNAVAVAWGLAGDQHAHGFGAAIKCLMALAWRDFESFTGLEDKVFMFDFEGQFSFENKEKLSCVIVGGGVTPGYREA